MNAERGCVSLAKKGQERGAKAQRFTTPRSMLETAKCLEQLP